MAKKCQKYVDISVGGLSKNGYFSRFLRVWFSSYHFNSLSVGARIAGSLLSTLRMLRILRYSRIRMHPVSSSIPAQGLAGWIRLLFPVSIDLDGEAIVSNLDVYNPGNAWQDMAMQELIGLCDVVTQGHFSAIINLSQASSGYDMYDVHRAMS